MCKITEKDIKVVSAFLKKVSDGRNVRYWAIHQC